MTAKPRPWWLLAIVPIAGAGYLVLRPERIDVETAPAVSQPMREVVREDGRTRVRERYTVTAPVAGRVERLDLREGATVVAGERIARIAPLPIDESTRAQAEQRAIAAAALVRQTATQVAQAEASLANARHALERRRRVFAEGAIAPEALERFALEAELAEKQLLAAQAAEDGARAEAAGARAALIDIVPAARDYVVVHAPAAGRVLRVPDASARVVAAGTPLIEIGDTEALEIVVPVLSQDAARIQPGACVEIGGWTGGATVEGRVRAIEPSGFTRISALGIEEQRVNVIVDLDIGAATVGDGYRVDAAIVLWDQPEVLQIPASALIQRSDGWMAFTVEDGRARERTLEIGHRDGATAEILSGLHAGEAVILFPSDRIADGVRVRVRNTTPGG